MIAANIITLGWIVVLVLVFTSTRSHYKRKIARELRKMQYRGDWVVGEVITYSEFWDMLPKENKKELLSRMLSYASTAEELKTTYARIQRESWLYSFFHSTFVRTALNQMSRQPNTFEESLDRIRIGVLIYEVCEGKIDSSELHSKITSFARKAAAQMLGGLQAMELVSTVKSLNSSFFAAKLAVAESVFEWPSGKDYCLLLLSDYSTEGLRSIRAPTRILRHISAVRESRNMSEINA